MKIVRIPSVAGELNNSDTVSQSTMTVAENGTIELPLTMYSFRRYFASNALGNGIPITDVAEWMGHKSIEFPRRRGV